jgi:hypothetical protein
MISHKWIAAVLGLALLGAIAQSGRADDSTTRKKAKVRARFFNPFSIDRSQITVDRFGIIRLTGASRASAISPTGLASAGASPTSTTAKKSADVASSASGAPAVATGTSTSPTTTTTSAASSFAASSATNQPPSDAELTISTAALRPPGSRPDVRSPFRPPARQPF